MPNETNWQDITRRLDISQASVTDTCNKKERSKGRAIKKIGTEFTVPAYSVTLLTDYPPEIWPARIVAQYNYSADFDFRILNSGDIFNDTTLTRFARLAVRWREGEVGHRYALTQLKLIESVGASVWTSPDACNPLMNVPDYTGQRIGAEFVIEVWTHRFFGLVGSSGGIPIGLLRDITFKCNRLYIPDNSDQTTQTFESSQTLHDSVEDGMAKDAANESLPVDYAVGGAWNSN